VDECPGGNGKCEIEMQERGQRWTNKDYQHHLVVDEAMRRM
jgi:hypothetical protein